MTHPIFFVKSVAVCLPRNKAQDYIEKEVKETEHRTIDDSVELERYHAWLQSLTESAHKMYPRTKPAVASKSPSSGGEHIFTIHYEKGYDSFVVISVCTIRGEWKGGIK